MISQAQVKNGLNAANYLLDAGYVLISFYGVKSTPTDTYISESEAFSIYLRNFFTHKNWLGKEIKEIADHRIATLFFIPVEGYISSQLAVDNHWVLMIRDLDYLDQMTTLADELEERFNIEVIITQMFINR